MLKFLAPFLGLATLMLALAVSPLDAQDNPSIAALTAGDIWRYDLNGVGQPVTRDGATRNYRDPFWSPSGNLLAFTDQSGQGTILYVTDLSGRPPVAVATNLHPVLPAAFSPDGVQVIYATSVSGSPSGPVQVFGYSPTAATAPVPLGTFDFSADCLQDSLALPPERARNAEARVHPNNLPLLTMTGFGVLHTTSCNRPDLWLMNPVNGQDRLIFEDVSGVFVSPEQQCVVVVDAAGTFIFVNTELGPYTQIAPTARADQVGFGLPGSNEVFYSTVEIVGPTPLPGSAGQALANVYATMPVSHRVTIRRFSLRTGRDDLLYEADAYAIGRLTLTRDSDVLLFSQIPNPDAWVQAIADGGIAADDIEAAATFFQPEIYALSLADNSVRLLGTGWRRFAVNTGWGVSVPDLPILTPVPTFTPIPIPPTSTIPPTFTPRPEGVEVPTESPTGIVIGAEMTINPGIGTINVRREPGTGSRVVELVFGNERVTVLDGPRDAEGFTWWHIRLPSGADGWIAERLAGQQTLLPDG